MSRNLLFTVVVLAIGGASGCQPMVYASAGNTSPHMPPQVWSDWTDLSDLEGVMEVAGKAWEGEKHRNGAGWGATGTEPREGPDRYRPITGRAARGGDYILAILVPGIRGLPGEGFDAYPGIVCDPTGAGIR